MLDSNAVPNDHAPVNQGQAKWMATQAKAELDAVLASGAGPAIEALVGGFSATGNNLPLNLGQLKFMAKPFYDRIREEGYAAALPLWMPGLYPWTDGPQDDVDFSIANLGQLKYVFSFDFDLCVDSDGDGMSDGFELRHNLNPHDTNDAAAVSTNPWAHGLTNLQVCQNPSVLIADDYCTAYNGIPDWWKVQHGLPLDDWWIWMDDDDGDGFNTAQEYARGSDPNHDDRLALLVDSAGVTDLAKKGVPAFQPTMPVQMYLVMSQTWSNWMGGCALLPEDWAMPIGPGTSTTTYNPDTGASTTTETGDGWPHGTGEAISPTSCHGNVDATYSCAFHNGEFGDYFVDACRYGGCNGHLGTQECSAALSDEFTTPMLIDRARTATTVFTGQFVQRGMGEIVARYDLSTNELTVSATGAKYKFRLDTAPGQGTVSWLEIFEPEDDPATANVDESTNLVYTARQWTSGGKETGEFTLNPIIESPPRQGRYSIAIPSASLTQVQGLRTPTVGQFTPLADPHADGRVFVDTTEEWAGTLLQPGQFDRQRVRLTATVDLKGIPPERCRIRWAVYDPDDPATNIWADTTQGNGGDNTGLAHEGGSHWFTSAQDAVVARGGAVPEADRTLGVLLETCDTVLTVPSSGDVESTVFLNLSDDGGDNFRVRAFAVVDDVAMTGDTSGIWTMWRKRVLVVDAMKTLDGLSTHYPADEQNLGHVQQIMHRAYANANPEHACYLDIAAVNGNLGMTAAGTLDVYSIQPPNAFQWNNYLYDELHSTSAIHRDCEFHTIGANYLMDFARQQFLAGTADNAPDAGIAYGYATTDAEMIRIGVSVSKLLVHEVGHLAGLGPGMHIDHTPGHAWSECAFSQLERGAVRLGDLPICARHCFSVRRGLARCWAPHARDEIRREITYWDSSR